MSDLVKYNDQMPTLPSDAPLGYEGIDKKDLPIPRVDLLQAKTKSVEAKTQKEGTLLNVVTGEVYQPGEEFIFLRYQKGAIFFDKDTEKLVCKSNNGEANTNGEECAACPHNVYYKSWRENNKPNLCVEVANMLAVRRSSLLKDPDVCLFTFKSTSITAAMNMVASAALKSKPLYLWAYQMHVEQKAKYRNVFVYTPKSSGYVTGEELEVLIKLSKRFADKSIEVEADTEEHAPAEDRRVEVDAF